jgi:hypothetical protein
MLADQRPLARLWLDAEAAPQVESSGRDVPLRDQRDALECPAVTVLEPGLAEAFPDWRALGRMPDQIVAMLIVQADIPLLGED